MIEVNALAHYRGSSPVSLEPTAVLDLSADRDRLQQLLQRSAIQTLREFLRDVPGSGPLLRTVSLEREWEVEELEKQPKDESQSRKNDQGRIILPPQSASDLESWLLRWFDGLQTRAGAFRLEKPRLRSPEPPQQGGEAIKSLHLRVQFDLLGHSLWELLAWLKWSKDLWEWVLDGAQRQGRRDLLASAPPGNAPHKSSLLAMARSLAERGVEWRFERLNLTLPMLVIGRGSGMRRVSQKITDRTGAWGLHCVKQKVVTTRVLSAAGFPVAQGRTVGSLREAVQLAEQLGYPVVTKPANEDQGKGVVTAIGDRETLLKAFRRSEAAGKPVLVQSHVSGKDFRFYVVKGKLLAALERIPAQIRGDGRNSVRRLVDAENLQRRKSAISVEGGEKICLTQIDLNQEAKQLLKSQDLSVDSILANGRQVRLSPSANFGMGGTVRECLKEVHPLNRLMLEKISRLFHLDIVGIDVIASSIDVPLQENGGVICEVNGMPGVLPHQLAEPERSLMAETVARLLEDAAQTPLIVVHGGEMAPTVIRALEDLLGAPYPQLAVIDRRGYRQGGVLWSQEDSISFDSQCRALNDPDADAFLMELDSEIQKKDGLPWKSGDLLLLLDDALSLHPSWERWLAGRFRCVAATPGRYRRLALEDASSSTRPPMHEVVNDPQQLAEHVIRLLIAQTGKDGENGMTHSS